MMNKFQQAMDQVTLSPEADERIQAVIEAAQKEQKVIPLHGGKAKKTAFRFGRTAVIAAVLTGLLIVTALAAVGINHAAFRTRTHTEDVLFNHTIRSLGEDGWLEVYFERTTDEFIELGVWEPDAVPVGFEKVDIFHNAAADLHRDTWANAAEEMFEFMYWVPPAGDDFTDVGHSFYDRNRILEQGNVKVNGVAAWYLVYRNSEDNVHTNLYWTRPDTGVGFVLSTFDLSLKELITIAEGVTAHG